jgi:hypothetical protein
MVKHDSKKAEGIPMKKALFSATAIALALTAGSTFAADLPGRK